MKKTTITVLCLVLLTVLVIWALPAIAGLDTSDEQCRKLNRPGSCRPPGITKQYDCCQRQGYTKTFIIEEEGTQTLFAVPEGKYFVLLRLYVITPWEDDIVWNYVDSAWQLSAGENFFLDARGLGHEDPFSLWREDFPEGCAAIGEGQSLNVMKSVQGGSLKVTVIGYFSDIE